MVVVPPVVVVVVAAPNDGPRKASVATGSAARRDELNAMARSFIVYVFRKMETTLDRKKSTRVLCHRNAKPSCRRENDETLLYTLVLFSH